MTRRRKPEEPRRATSISTSVCQHGTFTVALHDADGTVFATASMGAGTAVVFLEEASEKLSDHIEGPAPTDTPH